MFLIKRIAILVILTVFVITAVAAQAGSGREMTVEESYLQESIEIMIIRETARASSREQKMIALQYIGEAIERGNTSDEIRQTLDFLGREGTRIVARESGRVMNNFPDVRRQAARFLGQLGTEEAQRSLMEICMIENEPAVLQQIIHSLGLIGTNENNETVARIAWVVTSLDNTNPDNLVALAAIDAFQRIATHNNGLNSPEAFRILMRISEGAYIRPVQIRARDLMAELRRFGN